MSYSIKKKAFIGKDIVLFGSQREIKILSSSIGGQANSNEKTKLMD